MPCLSSSESRSIRGSEARYLAWTDLETAGTDETSDPIVEVAVVLTMPDLEEVAYYAVPVWPDVWNRLEGPVQVSPEVYRMHTDNGLWDDCARIGVPLEDAEARILGIMACYGDRGDFVLAGSGVSHFDRRFIDAQMPDYSKWLRYYCIDVGVLRRTLPLIGRADAVRPASEVVKSHRAMSDIRLHISEFRYMKEKLELPAQDSFQREPDDV